MTSPLNRASTAAFLVIVKICGMADCGRAKLLEESTYRAQNITKAE